MSNEFEQPVEPMSRTEDLLRTGTEEPVIAMSEIEKILRGEHIDRPHSRVADLLLQYNPSDILIEKSITENGTYYASADGADGYYKVVVDTPVIPPTVLEHLVETVSTNGTHTFTPGTGVDGFSDASITVNVAPNVGSKNITQNGNYAASSDNLDGYSNVNVSVAPNVGSKNITENGTYNASSDSLDGYSSVVVDVDEIAPQNSYGVKQLTGLPTDIATFNDGEALPLSNLKVAIEPVQDLHGQSSPYPAGGGANIWDEEWELGEYNTNTGANYPNNERIRSKNFISVMPSTTYYFKCANASQLLGYDNSKGYIGTISHSSNSTFTTPANCYYIKFSPSTAYGTTYKNDIAINYPSSVTTYSPYSNICPISGWDECMVGVAGKNLLNNDVLIWEQGSFSSSGVKIDGDNRIRTKWNDYIPVIPNTTYTFSIKSDYNYFFIAYDENDNMVIEDSRYQSWISNSTTITIQSATRIRVAVRKSNNANLLPSEISNVNIQCEFGSTPTEYTPYTDLHIYAIDLDGTRYGGELDVVSGVLTVDRVGIVYDGSSDEVWTISPSDATAKIIGTATGLLYTYSPILSNCFATYDSQAWNYDNTIWGRYGQVHVNPDSSIIPSGLTTEGLAEWRTWLSTHNLQICYSLATPLTIQLTPTAVKSLEGINNLSADCGQVRELSYLAHVITNLETINITSNGDYTPQLTKGYSQVTVNLPNGTNTEY